MLGYPGYYTGVHSAPGKLHTEVKHNYKPSALLQMSLEGDNYSIIHLPAPPNSFLRKDAMRRLRI